MKNKSHKYLENTDKIIGKRGGGESVQKTNIRGGDYNHKPLI